MRSVRRRLLLPSVAVMYIAVFVHYASQRYLGVFSSLASVSYNVMFGVAGITAILAAARLSAAGDARGAQAWRWLAISTTSLLLAQGVNVFRSGGVTTVLSDLFALACYPAGIVALWKFGPARSSRAARAIATIDQVMLAVAALTVWIAFETSRQGLHTRIASVNAFYDALIPAFAVVMVTTVGRFFMRLPSTRRPGDTLSAAALLFVSLGDLLLSASPALWDVWSPVVWATACLMLIVAAERAAAAPLPGAPEMPGPSLVPFFAIGAVVAAMLATLLRLGHSEPVFIGVGGATLVLLLVIRQWQVLQHNAALVRDISEKEQRLREARHLDALGRMSRGVAHDFNGMLMSILANAELAIEDVDSDTASVRESLEHIRNAALTAGSITAQLLAFARAGTVQMVEVDVAAVTQAQWPLLQSGLPAGVAGRLESPPGGMVVRTGAGFIEQMLHNLVANARDAMQDGGSLGISVRREGNEVMVRVTDSGHGMDATTRERIFEPFFTTKAERGSGLGLATVYGLVRQSGGEVEVQSAVGRGTTFTARFPAVDAATP